MAAAALASAAAAGCVPAAPEGPASPAAFTPPSSTPVVVAPTSAAPTVSADRIRAIRAVGTAVEIEVVSGRPFPVRGELAVLRIGNREFDLSRYPDDGDTHVLIFTLSPAEWAAVQSGEEVTLQYGHGAPPEWKLGRLDRRMLDMPGQSVQASW